jgi:hypothetical protein
LISKWSLHSGYSSWAGVLYKKQEE